MSRLYLNVQFKLYGLPPDIATKIRVNKSIKVRIIGSDPDLGSWNIPQALTAEPCKNERDVWNATALLPFSADITWSWIVTINNDSVLYWDPAGLRRSKLNYFNGVMQATWGLRPTFFLSQICLAEIRTRYFCKPGEVLAVVGSEPCLGRWDHKKSVRADEVPVTSGCWSALLVLDSSVSYKWKWVVLDHKTGEPTRWEERANRTLQTNYERVILDTTWNQGSQVYHQDDIYTKREVDMTRLHISNFNKLTCNNKKDIATKWLGNATFQLRKRFTVTDGDKDISNTGQTRELEKFSRRRFPPLFPKNVFRTVVVQLIQLVNVAGHMYTSWWRFIATLFQQALN